VPVPPNFKILEVLRCLSLHDTRHTHQVKQDIEDLEDSGMH